MANQKAELHNINLKTMDVSLNVFNHDISPYEGFIKNNSPYYGNILSPFYGRKYRALGDNGYITKDGKIYSISNGSLVMVNDDADIVLNDTQNSKYAVRESIGTSASSEFPIILAFFPDEQNEYTMLCSSNEGKLAVINKDGTVKYNFSSETGITYFSNELIHFAEYYNDSYCFGISDSVYIIDRSGNIHSNSSSADRTTQVSYSCVKSENHFVVCRFMGEKSTMFTIDCTTGEFTSVGTLIMNVPDSSPVSFVDTSFPLFFNRKRNIVFLNNTFRIDVDSHKHVFSYGYDLTYVDDSTLSFTVNADDYIIVDDLDNDKYEILSKTFDNNTCFAVLGYSNGGYDKVTGRSIEIVKEPIIVTTQVPVRIPNGSGGWFEVKYPVSKVVGYTYKDVVITDKVEHIEGSYKVLLIDGDNKVTYDTVPVSANGEYLGGLYSTLDDNLRVLYHGSTLQGLSVSSDSVTIGTLLCGMSEIDSNYPILYWNDGEKTNLYYHDQKEWQYVSISSDKTLAKMKVLNDEYILLNTTDYYNCFDTNNGTWYHFGSDWNDRAIIKCDYKVSDIPNSFDSYLNTCENYYFASAQAANYTALDIPFISSLFPSYAGAYPKNITNIDVVLLAGLTPNNQDVDIYYGRQVEYGSAPIYQYSVDENAGQITKYINEKLSNSVYSVGATIIPSMFADFIEGFINQGIIIDNNHSYIQIYDNTTKPVFAINFVSQLEGVKSAFIVQGQYYVVIGGSIYKYNNDTSAISAVVRIDNMELIGYSPYIAIFWSSANKTFYRFSGDNILEPMIQANEIDRVVGSSYNPNTLSIYVITDKNVLIISQDHLVKLEMKGYSKCYPLIYGCALSGASDTLLLSYDVLEGFDIIPIELKTKLYGYGNSVKAVNDCVYLRIFDKNRGKGKVVVSSETLNEISAVSESKEFVITSDMWDKESNTLFLRYQPKNQSATGFSFAIKSPFAIATMQISSSMETIQNSEHNI